MNNVDVVKNTYEAFGRGDIQAVLAAMDPKIEWREAEGNPYMPSGEAWVGPDELVANLFMKLGAEWDPFIVQPEKYHNGGDTIVVEGRYTGNKRKPAKAWTYRFVISGRSRVVNSRSFSNTSIQQNFRM